MNQTIIRRCAIYTRKSIEDGLEQEYNSLDAQRDACISYIRSQQWNGWVPCEKTYEDGGFSGATMNRPALKELLADIAAGKVDIVVAYKIDRLSRSLFDFADLFTRFEKHGTSFVSVTQQIDTSTSAGRMMLNILMTFAQYEREVITERIRDKFEASRKKGIWMGGVVPFGYKVENRKLIQVPEEAEVVKWLFKRYEELADATQVQKELIPRTTGLSRKYLWSTERIYRLLANPLYIGKVTFKGAVYDGEHKGIVDKDLFERVQRRVESRRGDTGRVRPMTAVSNPALLRGHIRCGHCGHAMIPTAHSKKKGARKYRYYTCRCYKNSPGETCPVNRVSACEIEEIVEAQLCKALASDTFAAIMEKRGVPPKVLRSTLGNVPEFWGYLFPAEKKRLVELFLGDVVLSTDGVDITLKTNGLKSLIKELEHEQD